MDLAYPAGVDTIPPAKRPYYDMDTEPRLEDYVPPAKIALGVCKELPRRDDALHGYEFRLGTESYPHLKLRVQRVDHHERDVWVYSVDTHDGFLQVVKYLSNAEADAWRSMVEHNRALKHRIEEALALAGYMTPKNLLQIDLPTLT